MSSNAKKRTVSLYYIRLKRGAPCRKRITCTITLANYQQIVYGNIANQIHGFTIDYGKFILMQIMAVAMVLDQHEWINKQLISLRGNLERCPHFIQSGSLLFARNFDNTVHRRSMANWKRSRLVKEFFVGIYCWAQIECVHRTSRQLCWRRKQRNGGHVLGVKYSFGDWILFLCKFLLLLHYANMASDHMSEHRKKINDKSFDNYSTSAQIVGHNKSHIRQI